MDAQAAQLLILRKAVNDCIFHKRLQKQLMNAKSKRVLLDLHIALEHVAQAVLMQEQILVQPILLIRDRHDPI